MVGMMKYTESSADIKRLLENLSHEQSIVTRTAAIVDAFDSKVSDERVWNKIKDLTGDDESFWNSYLISDFAKAMWF